MSPLPTLCAALATGLLLIGGAALPVPAHTTRTQPAPDACVLQVARSHGETRLVAVLTAPAAATTGSYRLHVTQPGGLTLEQSGDFAAPRGQAMELSEVTLTARPERLSARLSVTMGGRTILCPIATAQITL